MMRTVIVCLALMLSAPAWAAPKLLHTDSALQSVDITTGFHGSNLVIYGVRKNNADVAIIIRGPSQSATVRRKEQVAGIWMNRDHIRFKNVPAYYDLAISNKEGNIAPFDMRRQNGIGIDALDLSPDDDKNSDDVSRFREALIRNQQGKGVFPLEPKEITFLDQNFFKVAFYLPDNVPTGKYQIQTFLIDKGVVLESQSTGLKVAQKGFSADIFVMAQYKSALYALITISMALLFGLGAHVVLRRE